MRSSVLESEDRSPLPAPLAGQFLVFKLELEPPTYAELFNVGSAGRRDYRISVKRADGAEAVSSMTASTPATCFR